jgi:hypothetical protein
VSDRIVGWEESYREPEATANSGEVQLETVPLRLALSRAKPRPKLTATNVETDDTWTF